MDGGVGIAVAADEGGRLGLRGEGFRVRVWRGGGGEVMEERDEEFRGDTRGQLSSC